MRNASTSAPAPAKPPRRQRTNLTIDASLLARARQLRINLSQTSERALADEIRRVERERWLEENREALDSYNRFVEEHGLPLEALRLF